MSDLYRLGARKARKLLETRQIKAEDYLGSCLDRIRRCEPLVHAWAHLDADATLPKARVIDEQIAQGRPVASLTGIPVGVKDIFNTADMPTQMGSPIWSGFCPGNDARVVYYLRQAGALIPGKTVTAEFAVHAPGPTRNPHHLEHSPGTSSSGSAVAVATGMVPLALGTQTAGSIIRPASYCGVIGFKPSFGLIPRTGMLKTTDSLDTVGLFARSIEDVRLLFDVIRVHGSDYPISQMLLNSPDRSNRGARPWRLALVKGPKWHCAESYARQALFTFAERLSQYADVNLVDYNLPSEFDRAHDVHSTIYDCTLAYYFQDEFKKETLVSPIMYEIIRRGQQVSLEQYKQALQDQRRLADSLDNLLQKNDFLLNLSTGGEALHGIDSVDRPDNCLIWTLCGVPAINLPVFRGPNGLPFGLQVVARRYSDYLLLNFGEWLRERELVFDEVYPEPRFLGRIAAQSPVDTPTGPFPDAGTISGESEALGL